VIGYSTLLY